MRATKASVPEARGWWERAGAPQRQHALTDLKQLDAQGQIEIVGAAVVTRDPSTSRASRRNSLCRHREKAALSASKELQPTRTAFVAQVTEQSPDVIDAAIARLGGEIIRRPVSEGDREIAAARDPQRKVEEKARKELRSRASGIRARW